MDTHAALMLVRCLFDCQDSGIDFHLGEGYLLDASFEKASSSRIDERVGRPKLTAVSLKDAQGMLQANSRVSIQPTRLIRVIICKRDVSMPQ